MDTIGLSKKAMLEALEQTFGIVTTAVGMVKQQGFTIGRSTHYDWLKTDKEYAEAVESIQGVSLDFAESALLKSIKEGNIAGIIFYLKTKGKGRGYVENFDINVPTDTNKRFVLQVYTDSDPVEDQKLLE